MPDSLRIVEIIAPGRLHFGMLSLGAQGQATKHATDAGQEPEFGGAGVMVDAPRLHLQFSFAERFSVHGSHARRVREFAFRCARRATNETIEDDEQLSVAIEVAAAPRQHVGLGLGTQLGMSVAAGLAEFFRWPQHDDRAAWLAGICGRGARSAVGVYGFCRGGLIAEAGKRPGAALSPLTARIELPAAWRFVLITPVRGSGLSGQCEDRAFQTLRATFRGISDHLRCELDDVLVPAAREGNFAALSESIYRFGRASGECFAASQGGAFASRWATEAVRYMRELGVAGVGQTSWGPTLFALMPGEDEAAAFVAEMKRRPQKVQVDYVIAGVNKAGAAIRVAS